MYRLALACKDFSTTVWANLGSIDPTMLLDEQYFQCLATIRARASLLKSVHSLWLFENFTAAEAHLLMMLGSRISSLRLPRSSSRISEDRGKSFVLSESLLSLSSAQLVVLDVSSGSYPPEIDAFLTHKTTSFRSLQRLSFRAGIYNAGKVLKALCRKTGKLRVLKVCGQLSDPTFPDQLSALSKVNPKLDRIDLCTAISVSDLFGGVRLSDDLREYHDAIPAACRLLYPSLPSFRCLTIYGAPIILRALRSDSYGLLLRGGVDKGSPILTFEERVALATLDIEQKVVAYHETEYPACIETLCLLIAEHRSSAGANSPCLPHSLVRAIAQTRNVLRQDGYAPSYRAKLPPAEKAALIDLVNSTLRTAILSHLDSADIDFRDFLKEAILDSQFRDRWAPIMELLADTEAVAVGSRFEAIVTQILRLPPITVAPEGLVTLLLSHARFNARATLAWDPDRGTITEVLMHSLWTPSSLEATPSRESSSDFSLLFWVAANNQLRFRRRVSGDQFRAILCPTASSKVSLDDYVQYLARVVDCSWANTAVIAARIQERYGSFSPLRNLLLMFYSARRADTTVAAIPIMSKQPPFKSTLVPLEACALFLKNIWAAVPLSKSSGGSYSGVLNAVVASALEETAACEGIEEDNGRVYAIALSNVALQIEEPGEFKASRKVSQVVDILSLIFSKGAAFLTDKNAYLEAKTDVLEAILRHWKASLGDRAVDKFMTRVLLPVTNLSPFCASPKNQKLLADVMLSLNRGNLENAWIAIADACSHAILKGIIEGFIADGIPHALCAHYCRTLVKDKRRQDPMDQAKDY